MITKRQAVVDGHERGRRQAITIMQDKTADDAKHLLDWMTADTANPPESFSPPAWLSGEYAGESATEILGETNGRRDEDRFHDVCDAYEVAATEAYWKELRQLARAYVRGANHARRVGYQI